jgi:hypothetical protein
MANSAVGHASCVRILLQQQNARRGMRLAAIDRRLVSHFK